MFVLFFYPALKTCAFAFDVFLWRDVAALKVPFMTLFHRPTVSIAAFFFFNVLMHCSKSAKWTLAIFKGVNLQCPSAPFFLPR